MKIFSCLLIISCLMLSACEKEEGFPDGYDHPCEHMLGSFAYLPSSVAKIPYEGKQSVHFIDTFGNRLAFTIQRMDGPTDKQRFINYDLGQPLTYDCYESLPLLFVLESDSNAISFTLSLIARPFPGHPEDDFVADWLTILGHAHNQVSDQFVFFEKIIDKRTYVQWPIEINYETYTCFGRTFEAVTRDPLLYQSPTVFYNDTEGIVSFLDKSGKKWCFDRFE